MANVKNTLKLIDFSSGPAGLHGGCFMPRVPNLNPVNDNRNAKWVCQLNDNNRRL